MASPPGLAWSRSDLAQPARRRYKRFEEVSRLTSDEQSIEYISWLLDFIDDQGSGANSHPFEWYAGNPRESTRNLDRMRAKYPELYKIMQTMRNAWWARKINDLLASGGTYFIAIGQLHVLGPDGIPRQLQRLKDAAPLTLRENPRLEMLGESASS